MKERSLLRAVSLFSNCGAGDLGFARAGFNFDVMAELDSRRLNIASLNHPKASIVSGDLRETLPEAIAAYRKRAGDEPPALLAACPPCQGMSSAQSARGDNTDPDVGSRDHRNVLVKVVADAAHMLRPRSIVVENVPAFLTRQVRHPETNVAISAANYLIESLCDDYFLYPMTSDLADFGVPQSRRRSFLTFIKKDEAACEILDRYSWIPYPWPSHAAGKQKPVSVTDALLSYQLPPLDAKYSETATSEIPMHCVPVWPTDRYRMVSMIPPNSGLSAWENSECAHCGQISEDRSSVQCDACGNYLPRPIVRDSEGGPRLVTGFHSSYRRMEPEAPASTVTTASGHVGSDRTIHPWENRVLSPLECALLQTLPRSFKWGSAMKDWGHTNVRVMIGEAVPPLFTEKHGRILSSLLRGIPPRVALAVTDQRTLIAKRSLRQGTRISTRHAEQFATDDWHSRPGDATWKATAEVRPEGP